MKLALREFGFVKTNDDPEKLVLPGIVWVHGKEDNIHVFFIGFGWWHYAFRIVVSVIFK